MVDEPTPTETKTPDFVETCTECKQVVTNPQKLDGSYYCVDCLRKSYEKITDKDLVELQKSDIYARMKNLSEMEGKEEKAAAIRLLWDNIKIKEIVVHSGRKENYYHIHLYGGETITMNEEDSLAPKKFRMDFQRIHGILLPNLPNTNWACLLTTWLKQRNIKEGIEEISENQEIIDSICEYITASHLVKGIGGASYGTVYYFDNAILVPNEIIKAIALKINRSLQLRRVSNIMAQYLSSPTKTYRTNNGMMRMWRFDPIMVGVNVNDATEPEGDEDTP